MRTVGKGRTVWGMSARYFLLRDGLHPDLEFNETSNQSDLRWIHYRIGADEVCFVCNQQPKTERMTVVFRSHAKASRNEGPNFPTFQELKKIEGPWKVQFDPKWGGPGTVTFQELMDWTSHPDKGIKYYSGAAIYNKTINIDFEPAKDKQYFLQLEDVKDVGIAEVKINGKDKGVLWAKPFRIEISGEFEKGENQLRVKVVNSWYNRLVGDQMFPGTTKYTKTNIVIRNDFRGRPRKEVPLEPSGLMGPVTIQEAEWK